MTGYGEALVILLAIGGLTTLTVCLLRMTSRPTVDWSGHRVPPPVRTYTLVGIREDGTEEIIRTGIKLPLDRTVDYAPSRFRYTQLRPDGHASAALFEAIAEGAEPVRNMTPVCPLCGSTNIERPFIKHMISCYRDDCGARHARRVPFG